MDPSVYRSRHPAETPLYGLLESLFETVKGAWEDLFERRYGFWRGILDEVVADVGHAQWVFTVPKLLRPYFMHHRKLLGPLCTAAWPGLLDEDLTRLLLSWPHSGFSVHNFVTVPAGDGRALEALARYCLRNPVSLARLAPLPSGPASPSLAALRRGWAQLIRRVYEIDPLVCPRCRGVMRVVAFITEGRLIRRILDHLGASARRATQDRAPPPAAAAAPVSR